MSRDKFTFSFCSTLIFLLTLIACSAPQNDLPTVTPPPIGTVIAPNSTPTTVGNPPIVVIEGPVEAINVNVITIFDMDIHIDVNNPILNDIAIGDIIHVEGESVLEGNTIIIVAINVVIVNPVIIIIDDGHHHGGGVVIPPGCKITKKGNIKCTKKTHK